MDRKGGQKNREALLKLMSENPQITTTQMAAALGINRSAVSKHIAQLKADGLIRRIGPDKGGKWAVNE